MTVTGLLSIVTQPTRGASYLDRLLVSELVYDHVKVIKSTARTDHSAIIAFTGNDVVMHKLIRQEVYRKKSPQLYARFLDCVSTPPNLNINNSTQSNFDDFYLYLQTQLDVSFQ
jgi:hypothetical protein